MTDMTLQQVDSLQVPPRRHRSLWGDAWRRLIASPTARLGLGIVLLFLLSTLLARILWPYNPATDLNYSVSLEPPTFVPNEEDGAIYPFGTDKLGRDIFRRVIHGGWNSLRVGLVAVSISLIIGSLLGFVAGFYESMPLTPLERVLLSGGFGLVMGLLPAWIARQPFQQLLFTGLGIVSALMHDFLAGRRARVVLFAAAGLLLGVLSALLVSPYTAVVCGVLGLLIGGFLGLSPGGSMFSNAVMRTMDIILAFPTYLLAIAIVAFLGPGLDKGMIAIGFVGIPVYARLTRSTVLSVIQKEYILAAQAVGAGHGRILLRHIVSNSLSPLIVQATMGLAGAILSAAALGFLGLGAIPPEPEWGAMLGDSYQYLTSGAWWAVLFPGLAIMLSVLGFNLLGDGLRDALDPRLTR